jgi:hypothetical protein
MPDTTAFPRLFAGFFFAQAKAYRLLFSRLRYRWRAELLQRFSIHIGVLIADSGRAIAHRKAGCSQMACEISRTNHTHEKLFTIT